MMLYVSFTNITFANKYEKDVEREMQEVKKPDRSICISYHFMYSIKVASFRELLYFYSATQKVLCIFFKKQSFIFLL